MLIGGVSYFYFMRRDKKQAAQEAVKEVVKKEKVEAKQEPTPELHFPALTPLPADTLVLFVLGGPGAGKGTQCANLVRDYGFTHLSAGDLLREEQNRAGSEYGALIKTYIADGRLVPQELVMALLHAAMVAAPQKRFLVDGFPRKLDQALAFEACVAKPQGILYFSCPEEEMLRRLVKRGETSGRDDDNVDAIQKRFKTFREVSLPVVEHYEREGKVHNVSCLQSVDNVYAQTKTAIDACLAGVAKGE